MECLSSSAKRMHLFRSGFIFMMFAGFLAAFGWGIKPAEAHNVKEPVKVKKGETLETIAKRYGSTTEMWKKANFLDNHYLMIGQILNVVFPYRVTEGDQLEYLAKKYNTTSFAIKELNHLESDELKSGMVISIPVNSNQANYAEKLQKPKQHPKEELAQKNHKKQSSKKEIQAASRKENQTTTRKSSKTTVKVSGNKQIQMKATAYNIEGNEQWGDLTAMGTKVRHGVVAVDPKVIPLGTKLYVSGYDSPLLPKGGFVAIAEDTGGAIKGNRIDIYIDAPTHRVSDFGIQNVKVTILE